MISALQEDNSFPQSPGNRCGELIGGYRKQGSATMPDGLALPSMTRHMARGGSVDLAIGRQVYHRGRNEVSPLPVPVTLGSYRLIQNGKEKGGKRKITSICALIVGTNEIPSFPLDDSRHEWS